MESVLVGREAELGELAGFVEERVTGRRPGSLYVSGPPGTGKTACILSTLAHLKKKKLKMVEVYVNCMNMASPTSIYGEIVSKLEKEERKPSLSLRALPNSPRTRGRKQKRGEEALSKLDSLLCSGDKMICLVLDEIDNLITSNHGILYSAFQWTGLRNSNLILIGIANSLDLTERFLPKLKLHPKLVPRLIKFAPYTKTEIVAIITNTVLETENSFDTAAVELCARKSSAATGDIRKALDVCRRSLEKTNVRKRSSLSTHNGKALHKGVSINNNQVKEGPPMKVTCRDVLETLNEVYSSPVQRSSLPIQQKLILATAIALKTSGRPEISLSKMTTSYRSACKVTNTDPLDLSDIKSACDMLEAQGLLSIHFDKKNPTSGSKMKLLVDDVTARNTLNDEALVSKVLNATLV